MFQTLHKLRVIATSLCPLHPVAWSETGLQQKRTTVLWWGHSQRGPPSGGSSVVPTGAATGLPVSVHVYRCIRIRWLPLHVSPGFVKTAGGLPSGAVSGKFGEIKSWPSSVHADKSFHPAELRRCSITTLQSGYHQDRQIGTITQASAPPSPGLVVNDTSAKADLSSSKHEGRVVLYRGRWIKPLRLLVRLKILQLTGVGVLAVPIVQYTQQGHVSLGTYAAVGLVVSGAAIASAALWFYSRRYVGELSLLLPEKQSVRLSTLDFWGKRQETDVAISRVVPPLQSLTPAELREVALHAFIPLEVVGDRQYILSLRHGHLLHQDALMHLLTKGGDEPYK